MKKARMLISLLLLAAMLVSLTACAGNAPAQPQPEPAPAPQSETEAPAQTPEPVQEGSLKLQWFQSIGIDTIFEDPWRDRQSLYPFMIFDTLVAEEIPNSTVANRLASDWSVSEDGLTVTFTLRDDVVWSDGQPLTVEDVLFTFNAQVANPNASQKNILEKVEGFQAVADGTATEMTGLTAQGNVITLKLTAPDSLFVNRMAYAFILPKHLLADVPAAEMSTVEHFWSSPVGCGPYVYNEIHFPDYFTVKPNESFYGAQPGISNVEFISYDAGGADAVVAALISGDLDFASGNSINDMNVANNIIGQNGDVTALIQASTYTRFFGINNSGRADGKDKADLQKPEVRQAFDLIFDKETIASFYNGQAIAMSTFCNPNNPQYNSDIPLAKQDIAKAVEMLKAADYDFSQVIDMAYFYTDQTTLDILAFIQQSFAEAGITLELKLLEGDIVTLCYVDKNYDLMYQGSGVARPCDLYNMHKAGSSISYLGLDEERQETFNPLYDEYAATTDVARAKELADELQALDYQTRYIIPIYCLNTVVLYNRAHLNLPLDVFELVGCTNYRFEDWSLN